MQNKKQKGMWELSPASCARSVKQMREQEHYFFLHKFLSGECISTVIIWGSYQTILTIWRACYANDSN